MNDLETRRYNMFQEVHQFSQSHPEAFSPGSLNSENALILDSVINGINTKSALQKAGRNIIRQSSSIKVSLRASLRNIMSAMNRTARVMARTNDGLKEKFQTPRGGTDQNLIATVYTFLEEAKPFVNDFIRRGIPENFLEELKDLISRFEAAINQSAAGREQMVIAVKAINKLFKKGMAAVSEIDIDIRNRYAHDKEMLAIWQRASHVQRPSRKPKPDTKPEEGKS